MTPDPALGDTDAPLLSAAAAALAWLPAPGTLGLALSGGSDSTAMLHLMARAAPPLGLRLAAVTVDHGLRPEAADEAAAVGRLCTGLGLSHDILRWDHGPIRGNLMDQARRARYALIADWARERSIEGVALAHTATDQAETLLMGLARGAGLDGLCGMRARFEVGEVTFFRPFLSQGRAELRGYLRRHGLGWLDDPTNEDGRYQRIRARRALKALAPLGMTEARLADSARHLADAQGAVRQAAAAAARDLVREVAGGLLLDRSGLRAFGPELARRVLILCLMWLTRNEHPPRGAEVQRLLHAIAEGRAATLAGCRLLPRDEAALIVREPRALGPAAPAGRLWDGRWLLEGPARPGDEVRALGARGLAGCKGWRQSGLPREALIVSPALWRGETLVAAPLLDGAAGWSARPEPGFHQFALSH
ncbi:MAG: tRNA lysidine(34) synthetase TilS [Paracoccaceae bacterium]